MAVCWAQVGVAGIQQVHTHKRSDYTDGQTKRQVMVQKPAETAGIQLGSFVNNLLETGKMKNDMEKRNRTSWGERRNELFSRLGGETFTNNEVVLAHVFAFVFLLTALLAGAFE